MPDTTAGDVRDWRDVLLRLQQLTCNDQGVTVVNLQLVVERGMPKWWAILGQKRVEPAAAARMFVDCLRQGEHDA